MTYVTIILGEKFTFFHPKSHKSIKLHGVGGSISLGHLSQVNLFFFFFSGWGEGFPDKITIDQDLVFLKEENWFVTLEFCVRGWQRKIPVWVMLLSSASPPSAGKESKRKILLFGFHFKLFISSLRKAKLVTKTFKMKQNMIKIFKIRNMKCERNSETRQSYGPWVSR